MNFIIDTADSLKLLDLEITELLSQVYVESGFTTPEIATSLFEATTVRNRGKLIGAREKKTLIFTGMVIVAYPNSSVCHLAQGNETEMHLLGVKSEYRDRGLGKRLVTSAIHTAQQNGYTKMLLGTQATMQAAHRLYESSGFVRTPDRDFTRNDKIFWVYEKILDTYV